MRSRASAPPTPPSPPPMAPGHPPPSLGHRRPPPTPPLPPPPHQEGAGQGQGKGKGHQGPHRQEGTEGPQVRACTRRDRAPEATPHGVRTPPKNQEGAGTGTKTRRKRAPRQVPRPTPTGRPAPPHPHQTPQHTPPKQTSDAMRITPAHAHRPPETTRRTEGTPTRGERATPTEEAAGNTAARHTTMPSPPADDPDHHEGQLTGTGRGRKHGRGTHDYGPTPPEDTGPRHRPPGRATPRTVTRPHHGL